MATKGAGDSRGPRSEELLRNYFIKAGYFVVRGVPFTYEGFDVTDIDLWLYNRISSVSRELSIVDIKSKRTPQAIERIFWTRGLQEALGVSRAIVATTENRDEVKAFGKKMDVLVLDGRFLQRLSTSSPSINSRLTDEEFRALLATDTLGKLDGDWISRMREAKCALAGGLSFDSFNFWLLQAHFFAEQVLSRHSRRELGMRCFYLLLSYAAVAVDFILRDLSFLEESEREKILRDGFIYGARGRTGTKNLIDASIGLLQQFTDRGAAVAQEIRARVEAEISSLPANIISQFFSRNDTGRALFEVAKELEALGMASSFHGHNSASVGARSLIGCLLDFWSIDRRAFSLESPPPNQASVPIAEGPSETQKA
jgi:hypothetical protein